MAIIFIVCSVCVGFIAWNLTSFVQNYIAARRIGLPIVAGPFDIFNPLWTLGEPYLLPVLKLLPFGLSNFLSYTEQGWLFTDQNRLHDRLGPAFTIVSPSRIIVVVGSPPVVEDVLKRMKDFIKPPLLYGPLNLFGPNVDTVNGEAWQRHRRITTPPFNERNSSLVWKESLVQAGDMLKFWTTKSEEGVRSTNKDVMTTALHVLTAAGFGKTYKFDSGVATLAGSHTMSYRDALSVILKNVFLVIIGAAIALPPFLMTAKMQRTKTAVREFKQYMQEMVEEERSENVDKENLMSVLVRAAETESRDSKGRKSFTDEEILGNLFIYNLAGHDTTAGALAYSIAMLTIEPRWQDWIREELDSVFGSTDDNNPGDADYNVLFPQLKRCLAVIHETLRLYPPVLSIPRQTSDTQTITIPLDSGSKEVHIPPNAFLLLNLHAMHTNSSFWGSDALTWRPDRWLPDFEPPVPGCYTAWSSGPRICPGKKFAQVEFVAVLSKLLRGHKVSIVRLDGESEQDAKERVRSVAQDSKTDVTLTMRHPEKICLRWEKIA